MRLDTTTTSRLRTRVRNSSSAAGSSRKGTPIDLHSSLDAAIGAGRYAPTPTSDLHLGNLRTALVAWVIARRAGVDFRLRIEDLDQQRVAAAGQVARAQLDDLETLGLDWDGEVVVQSDRLDAYAAALATLDTYECFCTRKDIAAASQAPHDGFRAYPGTCRELTEDQRSRLRIRRPPALRVRAEGARYTVTDLFAGEVTGVVDDFVVVRNDGVPAYNLAVVVDDVAAGIGHVTRGNDLLDSAPRQAWLASQLGADAPRLWIHLGLAVSSSGARLAKRDGAVSLADLRRDGVSTAEVMARLIGSLADSSARTAADLVALDDDDWLPLLVGAASPWSVR